MKLPDLALTTDITSVELDKTDKVIIETDETYQVPLYEVPEEDINEAKYTMYIERIIRSSLEYKTYIQLLKNEFNLTQCKFYDNIDITEHKVSFEMHHYPATLFDIVTAVRDRFAEESQEDSYHSFKIAEEVMKLHYEGLVGLVPLTKTVHDLTHNGLIFIPLTDDYVFGDYQKMMTSDRLRFSDIYYEKLDKIRELTADYVATGANPSTEILTFRETEIRMKEATAPMKIKQEVAEIS